VVLLLMYCLGICATAAAVTLLNSFFLAASAEEVVRVNAVTGNDSACAAHVGGVNGIPCQTIERAYHLVGNSSNITLDITSNVTLNRVLEFRGLRNIMLHATRQVSISCRGESGIFASEVDNFTITNLSFVDCGHHRTSCFSAGVLVFYSCSRLTLLHVQLVDGRYSGLVVIECIGSISISEVKFIGNKYVDYCSARWRGAKRGGTHFRERGHSDLAAGGRGSSRKCGSSSQADTGGGLKIELSGRTSGSFIKIANCYFGQNLANWGGGVYVAFRDAATNHYLLIVFTVFKGNEACVGGGALRVVFKTSPGFVFMNKVSVNSTLFLGNHARFGAGVSFTSSYSSSEQSSNRSMVFRNCTWDSNTASLMSPAVDVMPYARLNSEKYGFLPSPCFIDSIIANNTLIAPTKLMSSHNENDGVFIIAQMQVHFSSFVRFYNNSPTAILAISGGIIVEENTTLIFSHNRGTNGAALALYGYSYVFMANNVHISFKKNKAKKNGAAIYYQGIDQHNFFVGSYCFLENLGRRHRNVTLLFEGNSAENGSWIYAQSFISCAVHCHAKISYPLEFRHVVECIGDFKFVNVSNMVDEDEKVSTSAQHFEFASRKKLEYEVVPGETLEIPYTITDEFNSRIFPLTYISTAGNHSSISFNRRYSLHNQFQPIGAPDRSANVDVTILGIRQIHFQFRLQTRNCSPGFVYDRHTQSCECGDGDSSESYTPVVSCTEERPQAVLNKPHWVGYIPGNSRDYRDLYFVPCLPPVCRFKRKYLDASVENLSKSVCGEGRTGVMCGQCKKDFSMSYHSKSFACKPSSKCKYGFLLYIVSELLPILVVFLVVMVFDLSLTSGGVVCFIFFCQYLETMTISADSELDLVKIPYRLFYGMFNLNFFSIESLSFCLFKGSRIQDVVFFEYCAAAFAIALVILQIASLKIIRSFFVRKSRKCFRLRRSYVRGLCAFLVLFYFQCTKTSFFILKYVRPEGLNGTHENYYTYYGGEHFFHGRHQIYATIAILFLVLVTVTPSLILLLHPLLRQTLSLFRLSEHRFVLKLLKLACIHNLVLLLDCFQSCYQDRYRVFAGLYFLYRVALLLCLVLSESYVSLLVWGQLLLLIFLGVHATFQPCKKNVHNQLDSLILSNLSLINLLAIMAQNEEYTNTLTLEIAQTTFIYLPMLVCVLLAIWRVYSYCKVRCRDLQATLVEEDGTRTALSPDTREHRLSENSSMVN